MSYTIEDNLLKLDPGNFNTIKDYLIQVDMYRAQLKDCGEPIKDGKMMIHLHVLILLSIWELICLLLDVEQLVDFSLFFVESFLEIDKKFDKLMIFFRS
ncbi:hypothetical protein P3S40_26790 [Enterobacter hormaechei]|nr:hypothetical protein [Enterobacter hormaechei]MDF3686330.1 hypothetical protein [Enterobacter hormaechei]